MVLGPLETYKPTEAENEERLHLEIMELRIGTAIGNIMLEATNRSGSLRRGIISSWRHFAEPTCSPVVYYPHEDLMMSAWLESRWDLGRDKWLMTQVVASAEESYEPLEEPKVRVISNNLQRPNLTFQGLNRSHMPMTVRRQLLTDINEVVGLIACATWPDAAVRASRY